MANQHPQRIVCNRIALRVWLSLALGFLAVTGLSPCACSQDFLSTGSSEYLNIVGRVPLVQHAFKDKLILFFDRTISEPTSKEDTAAPPIRFEPELDGRISISGNALSFIPKSVTPEQIYLAVLSPQLRSTDGYTLNPKHGEFRLATAPFRVKRIWVIEESETRVVMGILLSYSADLGDLETHLDVRSMDGKAVPYDLKEGEDEKVYRLALTDLSDLPIRISVTSGLKDKTGTFETQRRFTNLYPEESVLLLKGISWAEYSRDAQIISIKFSKDL